MRRSAWTTGVAVIAALSLGVAACGGGDDPEPTPSGGGNTEQPKGQKPGGKQGAGGPRGRRDD